MQRTMPSSPSSLALRSVAVAAAAGSVLAIAGACASTSARFDGPDGDRRLYEARCGLCHVPFRPRDFEASQWPSLVDDMAGRAGLTRVQRERVLAYLVNAAALEPATGAR